VVTKVDVDKAEEADFWDSVDQTMITDHNNKLDAERAAEVKSRAEARAAGGDSKGREQMPRKAKKAKVEKHLPSPPTSPTLKRGDA